MKQVTRYEVRIYPAANSFSVMVGTRLWTRQAKARFVRRLRRLGFDAFAAPCKIIA